MNTPPPDIYTLSLHDALPICSIYLIRGKAEPGVTIRAAGRETIAAPDGAFQVQITAGGSIRELTVDRKSTRLNSSHRCISYAVFCLKKKKKYKKKKKHEK